MYSYIRDDWVWLGVGEMKTKLNVNDIHHQILIGFLTMFVDDYGYSSRELFELLEDAKNQLFFSLMEIEKERKKHD